MKILHLRVENDTTLTIPVLRSLIRFVEDQPEEVFETVSGEEREKKYATISKKITLPPEAIFVNGGDLHEMTAMSASADRGLLVNTAYNVATVFFLAGDQLRVGHIDFDFPEYVEFLFSQHVMRLMHLTDVDRTILRLAMGTVKHQQPDGSTVEQLKQNGGL